MKNKETGVSTGVAILLLLGILLFLGLILGFGYFALNIAGDFTPSQENTTNNTTNQTSDFNSRDSNTKYPTDNDNKLSQNIHPV